MKLAFLVLSLALSSTARASTVGYGWADSVMSAKDQEAFFAGFELAMKAELGEKRSAEVLTLEQSTNGSPLGALQVLAKLRAKHVQMLVGFPSSHEAVQIAKATKDEKILTVFTSAGNSLLAEFGPKVYTTGESSKGFVEATITLLRSQFPSKKGLFVYNPRTIFSLNQKEQFIEFISRHNHEHPDLEFQDLDEAGKLRSKVIDALKKKNFSYIVLTPYADESSAVLGQLNDAAIDLPIVSNASWTTLDIEMIRRLISNKKEPIFVGAVWAPGSSKSKEFEKRFSQRYGGRPTSEHASGYDLGMITATVIKRAQKDLTAANLLKVFNENRCFDRTTVGKMCFPATGGHATKPLLYMRLTKDGLIGPVNADH